MKTTVARALPAAAVAGLLLLALVSGGRAQSGAPEHSSDAVGPAIDEALRDELRGEAIYARVLKDHGDVRPFTNVVRAERRHAEFLEGLLKARGLTVPPRPAEGEVAGYASAKEACAAAVPFEAQNVALYDRLLAAGPLPGDVKQAFEHNRMASLEHHKPAFERCAGAAAARGRGRSAGHSAGPGAGCGGGCGQGRGPVGPGHGHGGHGGGSR